MNLKTFYLRNAVRLVVVLGQHSHAKYDVLEISFEILLIRKEGLIQNIQNCFAAHQFVFDFGQHQNILFVLSDRSSVAWPQFDTLSWDSNLGRKNNLRYFELISVELN